jgi:phosphoribosylaminoimidazolecarboxamide formyltransferase/IMP cyclohydrolase
VSVIRIGRALLSVSDKTGLAEFAHDLARHGVKILSTGGTAAALREAGVTVRDVSEATGFPELFEGRVKTLHPAIHGGILYRRGMKQDEEDRHRHGIVSIDLVVVNLYPFERTVAATGTSYDEAIEQIDIGGPAMIRAAAKNHRHVAVVVDPSQYASVIEALDRDGGVPFRLSQSFAQRAFARTSTYDAAIATYLESHAGDGSAPGTGAAAAAARAGVPGAIATAGGSVDEGDALPEAIELRLRRVQTLRYGENPGQAGALYGPDGGGAVRALTQLRGKTLSFNNLLDVEAALRLLHEIDDPAAVVIKHRNPSGAATARTVAEAIPLARDGDSLSAFGGILGLNRALDDACLDAIGSFFYEVVLAPAIAASEDRLQALRKNLIVLEVPALLREAAGGWVGRTLFGGMLVETPPGPPRFDAWKEVSRRAATDAEMRDLRFAWRVARHVISNAIVIAREGRTLGIGAGQSSRVDAVRLALRKAERAGHDVRGAVLTSDAFFPFSDSVEIAAEAGIAAIAHPGGSVRDAESVAAADKGNVTLITTGERCFLH